MKLPLSWAQSFAPFSTTPREFAEKMTMTGSKVEYFQSESDNIKNVIIGRIASLERHADSDHLWVCRVDIGAKDGEPVQIVTGAQNLKENDICPVALHGAKLPNGTQIKKGKLRGVASDGMLCSLGELGLTLNDYPDACEDGILVLSQEGIAPGDDAAVALGMDEVVFEFEITPNRPDCLSVRGLAREAAATFGVPFEDTQPQLPKGEGDISQLLSVGIKAEKSCMRYSAAMVDNVRIAQSPLWMRRRLRHAGVRPINNIVDITNYVMLEYGQPMHAFDYAYVNGGQITVRNATEGEGIVTLDGATRTLSADMMVIADEKGPIAVAGVMGGEYSGVYDTTQKVVFESAAFDGPAVRSASKKLGLRTESSGRFEKGLDPNLASLALCRALELVVELNAGDVIGGVLDVYPSPRTAQSIPLCPEKVNTLLGTQLSKEQMTDILKPLGFGIEGDVLTIPTTRADMSLNCDIAEEVARFVGYNTLPATILSGSAKALPTHRQRFDEMCVSALVGCGMWQCQTFSFYSPKCFDMIALPKEDKLRSPVRLMNPLGEETSVMRTTALPSILEVAARNWAARTAECAVFEKATVYLPSENAESLPTEEKHLVMAAYGGEWDYLALKGVAEKLLSAAFAGRWEVKRNTQGATFHPGRAADIYLYVKGESEPLLWGTIGEVHPNVLQNYDIKTRVVAAQLSWDVLYAAAGDVPQYKTLPRFPAISRDLALVMDAQLAAAEVESTLRSACGARLEALQLFDVYTGEKMEIGKKSLAYSLTLRDASATLTDTDADAIIAKSLQKLEPLGVTLRS